MYHEALCEERDLLVVVGLFFDRKDSHSSHAECNMGGKISLCCVTVALSLINFSSPVKTQKNINTQNIFTRNFSPK